MGKRQVGCLAVVVLSAGLTLGSTVPVGAASACSKPAAGANLTGCNFNGANLTNATLSRATLANATLTGANLNNATLTGAILTGVTSGKIAGTPAALPTDWQLHAGYLIG